MVHGLPKLKKKIELIEKRIQELASLKVEGVDKDISSSIFKYVDI